MNQMELKDTISEHIATITDHDASELKALIEKPKQQSFGDYAFPCFTLARTMRKNPVEIAKDIEAQWNDSESHSNVCSAKAVGPYVNFTIPLETIVKTTVQPLLSEESIISRTKHPEIILIESPGPNTNKPLHLGHLRNMLLGDAIKSVHACKGHDARIVNVVNDRGIHICKSMLAYQKWGEGKTPASEGVKPDHFVGQYYVLFSTKASESEEAKQRLEEQAQDMLRLWEQGDEQTLQLWKKMNSWVYEGFDKTYKRLGFSIEKDYYESETYTGGKDLIREGLEKGVFETDENGAIVFNPSAKDLGKKVMLRSDGTSVYITQDVNMARLRYEEFSFDRMIYVVANEQEYHFKMLFEVFKALDFPFANKCSHFAYGMVELPDGKMKSREGTVIDADDIIDGMTALAREEVNKRYTELDSEDIEARSESIALSAIRFFFLKHDPLKNFVFNKDESLSFDGETGPYVQYTHARIASIMRKSGVTTEDANLSLLNTEKDRAVMTLLGELDSVLDAVSAQLKPSILCHYLIKVCQEFNSYYVKHKIIQDDKELEKARLALIGSVKTVLATGLDLLGIDALERM